MLTIVLCMSFCSFYFIMVSLMERVSFEKNMSCFQQNVGYDLFKSCLIHWAWMITWKEWCHHRHNMLKFGIELSCRHWLNFSLHLNKLGIGSWFLASGLRCLISWSGLWMSLGLRIDVLMEGIFLFVSFKDSSLVLTDVL